MNKILYTFLLYCCAFQYMYAQCNEPDNPGLTCEQALFLCGDQLDGFCSTLPPDPNPTGPHPLCGGGFVTNNTEWISFVAGTTNLTLMVEVSSCNTNEGIQFGITKECNTTSTAAEIVCNPTGPSIDPKMISTNNLIVGDGYYLWLDGFAGDVCDYVLTVLDGAIASDLPPNTMITGPAKVCPESVPAIFGLNIPNNNIVWTTTPPLNFTDNGTAISINDWGTATSVDICADLTNFCPGSSTPNVVCKTITVDTIYELEEGPFFYCPENDAYLHTDGNYYKEGIHTVVQSSSSTCDSIFIIEVISYDSPITNLDTIICAGDFLTLGGNVFDSSVTDSLITTLPFTSDGCRTQVLLNLEVVEIDMELEYGTDSDCSQFSNGGLLISPVGTLGGGVQPIYQWESLDGMICNSVSNESTLLACALGEYCLTITDQITSCDQVVCITLTEEDLGPDLSFSSIIDTCGLGAGSLTVDITGNDTPYTIQWNDPANQTTPTAQGLFTGNYQVTVTGESACSTVENFSLSGNTPMSVIIEVPQEIECFGQNTGVALALVNGGELDYSYQWDMNAGNQTERIAIELFAGTYWVTVTDKNGCTISDSVVVNQPEEIVVDIVQITAAHTGATDGAVTVSINGGVPPYNTVWDVDPVQMDVLTLTDLAAGTYGLIVTDANNCTSEVQIEIPLNTAVENPASGISDFQLYPNPNTGHFYLHGEHLPMADLMVEIYDILGRRVELVDQEVNSSMGQSGAMEVKLANPTVGLYLVKVMGKNNKELVGVYGMLVF